MPSLPMRLPALFTHLSLKASNDKEWTGTAPGDLPIRDFLKSLPLYCPPVLDDDGIISSLGFYYKSAPIRSSFRLCSIGTGQLNGICFHNPSTKP